MTSGTTPAGVEQVTVPAEAEFGTYVATLMRGEVVACPTETQQGLMADALNGAAVRRVIALKQRGSDPIALILPNFAWLVQLAAHIPMRAAELAQEHWPGPLTLLVRTRTELPEGLTLDGKVGVRVPGPSPALGLVRAFDGPLTATSANLAGQPPARTDEEVRAYFGPDVQIVPGRSPGGLPSTILDVSEDDVRVVRQGAIKV